MKDSGPWVVAGRVYRDWSKVPRWFRQRDPRKGYGRRLELPEVERPRFPWRGLCTVIGFGLLVWLVAEALWCL